MPDVTKLLNQDHRRVEQLFEQFEATEDIEIARTICQELTIHTRLEEDIVYPSLEKIDAELEKEAEKEHDEAKELIAKIQRMEAGDAQLVPTMTKLKEAVQHHVQEEESEAWPKMRDSLGTDKLDTLGTKVEEGKQKLMGSGAGGLLDLTKEELYEKAKKAGIEGRSSMTKDELASALQRTS